MMRTANPFLLSLVPVLGSLAALGTAFASQYLGGLQPCILCVYQRWPYGLAVVLGLAAIMLARSSTKAAALLLALAGLAVWVSGGIGAFHVGVEQGWWQGTAECGSQISTTSVEALRQALNAAPVVRCDQVPWSLFGISIAGYNLLYAALLGALTLTAAYRLSRSR